MGREMPVRNPELLTPDRPRPITLEGLHIEVDAGEVVITLSLPTIVTPRKAGTKEQPGQTAP
jgi:hypothetical protein